MEIDFSFYRISEISTVISWKNATPDDFLFYPNVPQAITHEKKLLNTDGDVESFLTVMKTLRSKLATVLFQFPPSFSFDIGFDPLKTLVKELPTDIKFAVEFRHQSRFRKESYSVLRDFNVTMA